MRQLTYIEALVGPVLLLEVEEVHAAAVGEVDGGVVADEERRREGAHQADPLRVRVRLRPLSVDLGDLGGDSTDNYNTSCQFCGLVGVTRAITVA